MRAQVAGTRANQRLVPDGGHCLRRVTPGIAPWPLSLTSIDSFRATGRCGGVRGKGVGELEGKVWGR